LATALVASDCHHLLSIAGQAGLIKTTGSDQPDGEYPGEQTSTGQLGETTTVCVKGEASPTSSGESSVFLIP